MTYGTGLGLAVAGLLFAGSAMAQQEPASGGSEAFEPGFFDIFAPVSALDMVQQVPGFSIDGGDSVRGFGGAAGNVLINGERPSTKGELTDVLQRIPADSVVRIDLVRGAVAGLDMRGQTRVVNVITDGSAAESQISWLVSARAHRGGRGSVSLEGSWTGRVLGGTLTLGLERRNWGERDEREERIFDAADVLVRTDFSEGQDHFWAYKPSFDFERALDGQTTLRLNGFVERDFFTFKRRENQFSPDRKGALTGITDLALEEFEWVYQLGGDLEREVSDQWSWKLITFHERTDFEFDQSFDVLAPDGTLEGRFLQDIKDKGGESILRGQMDWTPNDRHAIAFGLEAVYNFFETDRVFNEITPTGPRPANVPASPKVEEVRYEAFISDIYRVNDRLVLEPGLKYEHSTLTQSGAFEAERTLRYWKPGLTATWSVEDDRQLRLAIERKVSQLDFSDFVTEVSAVDDRVTSGNRELEPQQVWEFLGEWEQGFWDNGLITFLARYDLVDQVEDLVPVTSIDPTCTDDPATPANECVSVFDASGNLGRGTRWVVGFDYSVPLERVGLANARVDGYFRTSASEVDDPVTGEPRKFSGWTNHLWYIEFRQDFPEHQISWGFDYYNEGSESSFRLAEVTTFNRGHGDLDVYVETNRFGGVNLRVGVDNVFDFERFRERRFFSPDRAVGVLTGREERRSTEGPLFFIRAKGTF